MSRFIHPKPAAGARARMFCFPYAGGGAAVFQRWSDSLPGWVQVCPVQLPGREDRLREPPRTVLADLVGELLEVLRDFADLPFVFFGHSMGALISYTLCRELRRAGLRQPARLFVSGARAPHLPARTLPIHRLPREAFVAELRGRYDGIPRTVLEDREMMELFLPLLRADLELVESAVHVPEAPLECPISAFGGLEDRAVRREELEAWREQTRAGFRLRMLRGGHFYFREERAALMKAISEDLCEADAGEAAGPSSLSRDSHG